MRILLAGATGVIGRQLLPLLVASGHEVVALTRRPAAVAGLEAVGATAAVADVYDLPRLVDVMIRFRPESVVHQLTDLPDDPARIFDHGPANNRIRREGTENLLRAAAAAGARRFLAQSVAWRLPGEAGEAADALEAAVLDAGGVVFRYGQFTGPGTYWPDRPPPPPRIDVAEAARRTVELLDAPSGVIVIDDGSDLPASS